jgi:CDP-diacylglycerol--glycerol-3-phosphate 3-phosphatidyltransferase
MVFYARYTEDPASLAYGQHSPLNVFLAGAALVGSVLVSYASARAESLIPKCDVGFLRRPERVVLLIIGGLSTLPGSSSPFANRMPAVLWVLTVGSYWTFAYRMYHTWSELQRTEGAATRGAPAATPRASGDDDSGGEPTAAATQTAAGPDASQASAGAGGASNAGAGERHGTADVVRHPQASG